MRRVVIFFLVLCLLVPCASPAPAVSEGSEEKVAFNRESRKYHCLECRWAKACTVNCVTITQAEAERRGGVACKVCGGSCE